MNNPYERLANAIILQAAKDYRLALKILNKHPQSSKALYIKKEVEQFFHSNWYSLLTTIDPEMIIHKLNQEVIR